MKRNMMRKNLRQSILKSLGRYIAIVAIIALGASMFVGLLMTKSDMVITGQEFTRKQNMFDLRLISTWGWGSEDVERIARMEGVADAEGLCYVDLIAGVEDGSSEDAAYRFYTMPRRLNRLALRGGRWPERADECLADGYRYDDSILGTKVTIADNNEESTLEAMRYRSYTIVGYVASPLYMDMNRGTTTVGSGSLANYFYVPEQGMNVDYYTEIHISMGGEYELYSEEYNQAMESMCQRLEPEVQRQADARLERLRADAQDQYRDGVAAYARGVWEFLEGKEESQAQLAKAYQDLTDAEVMIAENEALIADAEPQIASAKQAIASGAAALAEGRAQFEESKAAAYGPLDTTQRLMEEGAAAAKSKLSEIDGQLADVESELSQLDESYGPQEAEITELNGEIARLEVRIGAIDVGLQAARSTLETLQQLPQWDENLIPELQNRIAALEKERSDLAAQRDALVTRRDELQSQLQGPLSRKSELESQKSRLLAEKSIVQTTLDGMESGLEELSGIRAKLDEQFANAEAELIEGEKQLAAARWQLSQKEKELADGKIALEQAKQDLADGWVEYESGKLEAEQSLADAEKELRDAKQTLAEAEELLGTMTEATVFVMDRNTNMGYNSLDSSSDIVEGVSRVFPAFFLLVAALVCITTMTRMIDEERTQIGTLKALGYSNGAIISKYLFYAGSGAVVGCGLGVLVGSVVFPSILWEAYKIMLYITPGIQLRVNWVLCGIVVAAYTAVMLLVTWYCCRRALREEPAELIRPKAPDPGKKILLERMFFWKRLSFLNKVTIRNIFRYRQRLAMMMVGIGGCTALLVTGFGLRDSVVNVVDYQFQEVTTYDLSVYFKDGQTLEEQESFCEELEGENVLFYHQSSMELIFENKLKEIYLISAEGNMQEFMDFHRGDEKLAAPGPGQMLLSVGAAEAMGIGTGDTVILRNSDMQVLELTVSGIYENHVYNYAVVSPQTIQSQWGSPPQMQMAFVNVAEGEDAYNLSTRITGMNDVVNVSVSEEIASMVGKMMEALDLVVIVVVVCAGILAAIVLYNLTNININERIREIATIKVLGFNSRETAAYVFKENLSLSAIGAVVGLFLGRVLLVFVMSQIKIDMVWFKDMVMPMSYVWSVVLTMLTACVVDFIFYFKLEKINMAEALKSVE